VTSDTRNAIRPSSTKRGVVFVVGETVRRRILIVDDCVELRELLSHLLIREGWLVDTAANGREAIALLEQHLPDVMLIDLSMPDVNGWTLLDRRQLEPAWLNVPCLVMSADHQYSEAVVQRGATGFLPKPFTIERLRAALFSILGASE
jgi:CheY-like chemotaxis protein